MVKNCIYPIANTGDLKQVFLQIRIAGNNRDVLRFHWISDLKTQEAQVLRFTKAIFSLNQSQFLLGRTLENHLQKHAVGNVKIATTFREDLYVDDLLGGTEAIEQARQNKEASIVVFGDATFELHKWHSNIRELHGENEHKTVYKTKQHTQHTQNNLQEQQIREHFFWDILGTKQKTTTKRGILHFIASLYDLRCIILSLMLLEKLIY